VSTSTATSATTYEAETLATTSSAVGHDVGSDAGASNGQYAELSGTPANGDWIQFTLPGIAAGTYTVGFYYKGYANRGINQAKIDTTNIGTLVPIGTPTDEYTAGYTNLNFKSLSSWTLAAGDHTIRFTTTGKGSGSAYTLTVDKIVLTRTSSTSTITSTVTETVTATTTNTGTNTSTNLPATVNLSLSGTASASSQQGGKEAVHGNDGSTVTGFCPSSSTLPDWWKVDLGASHDLTSTDINFENSAAYYKYKIEVSTDNSAWSMAVDMTGNTTRNGFTLHDDFTATARYVRITINAVSTGAWGCILEATVNGYSTAATSTKTVTASGTATNTDTATGTSTSSSTTLSTATSTSTGTTTGTQTTTTTSTGTGTCTSATTSEAETLPTSASAIGYEIGSNSGATYTQFTQSGTPAVGDYLQFTLPSVAAGTYTVDLYYRSNNNRGINQASIDGVNIGTTDEYATSMVNLMLSSLGSTMLTAGSHTIRFTITGKNTSSTAYHMTVDKIVLTQTACTSTGTTTLTGTGTSTATTTANGTVTATTLGTTTGTTTGTGTVTQTATATSTATGSCTSATTSEAEVLPRSCSGGAGCSVSADLSDSGGQHVNFTTSSSTAVGDYQEYTLPSVAAGTYTVDFYYTSGTSRGINQASIDGVNIGGPTDEYAGAQAYQVVSHLGSTTLTAGSHTIRFTMTGKNASASWYNCTFDKIVLAQTACTSTTTTTVTGTGTWTATTTGLTTVLGTATSTSIGTATATASGTATGTTTVAASGTGTGTMTGSGTVTATTTGTGTATGTLTLTGTGTATSTATGSGTTTYTAVGSGTFTQTGVGTLTGTSTGTSTSTSTLTATGTKSTVETRTDTVTVTDTTTFTETQTQTRTATAVQVYACGSSGGTDTLPCDNGGTQNPTSNGFCNETGGINCATDTVCGNVVKGDFCRAISSIDGSGRHEGSEACILSSSTKVYSCKHGVVTANTPCTLDSQCSTLSGDYCAEGQPAKMCSDTGLWCANDVDCPGGSNDQCRWASSRMMISKRALRRAIADHAKKVNFGFMSTYQGKGIGGSNASTEIFPYVQLKSCSGLPSVTETKFLARGELERGTPSCFSLTSGPSSSCTIDYGGAGAVNGTDHAALNSVTYSLVGTSDSRWGIPRSDGSGKYTPLDTSWSSCSATGILPACVFDGQGTGMYQGSYYTFTYKQGEPLDSHGVDGEGSRANPAYFTTYKGKYYSDGTTCYNAVDAERTDIVNDGIYGRPAYTGHPYDYRNEVGVPWGGSSNTGACDPTTGAIWNQNMVPFLNDPHLGSTSITTDQKTLMIAARLDKASFGGVDATGKLAPLGCALNNDAAADRWHSAAAYMSKVQTDDAANNVGGKPPCWSNNIVLVVDGQSNGPYDAGSANCASDACALSGGTSIDDCNCLAIKKAYMLSHATPPIQTHVVVNAPATWSARYPYSYAFLWNLALAGSPNRDGTPAFGTSEEEVYKAVSAKIAAAAYRFPYTTTAAVAGATSQDPTSKILTPSSYLYDTSVSYPSWKGTLRAFDTTSTVDLKWDAVTVAGQGHPANWTKRRIFFSKTGGTIEQVSINDTGDISNKGNLKDAGLGATSDEAEKIMQWLLGKPTLGNPAPLMGSTTSSTPIAVGQGAVNGLNGSSEYSKTTWKRPQLVYVGGDDGMLHAFFGHAGSLTLAGTSYQGGEEAFAFIPHDMMSVINKLYAQGSQKLAVDKGEHVFGLAGSPKVKDMCFGLGCADSTTGFDWHTVLVMPEGQGGNKPFALDITNVIDEVNGLHPGQMSLLWNPGVRAAAPGDWDKYLGETTSVPAFYFAGYTSGSANNRVIFASGYPTKTGVSGYENQGLVIVNADVWDGTIKDHQIVSTLTADSCSPRHRAVMADVGLARDYTGPSTSQNLLAAYVADTWGNTFQYVPGASDKVLTKLYSLGCAQPIYFSPAVVQLDRVADKSVTSAKGQIYLVQVTNSNLDSDTMPVADDHKASKLVVTKLDGTGGGAPVIVTAYNPNNSPYGQIVLTTGTGLSAEESICIQNNSNGGFTDGVKKSAQGCAAVDGVALTSAARPVGTPVAILRADGLGFQVITSWYDPTSRTNDCSEGHQYDVGTSYITVHEFGASGAYYQLAGVAINNTVLTGVTFVGTGLFVDGINASSTPQTINIGETFSSTQQLLNNASSERYARTSWTERLE
jgi:hypothetical protein